jgi:nitroreductase
MSDRSRRNFLGLSAGMGAGLALGSLVRGAAAGDELAGEMSLFEAVRTRRSVRKYKSTPIPEEHIERILDAARLAPTSGNQQPWKFLVVRDPAKIRELKEACIHWRQAYFLQNENPSATEEQQADRRRKSEEYYGAFLGAPVCIIVLTDDNSQWPTYNQYDGPLAVANLMLAARALGYGTVFATDSVPDEVTREVFHIPESYTRVCFTPVGVPESWPEMPAKKPLAEFVVHDTF